MSAGIIHASSSPRPRKDTLLSDLPRFVIINEEGPREGFQIEKGPIATARKIELIDALSGTGLQQIQTVSFVAPNKVPGMADAEAVVAGFTRQPRVAYTGLWLNERGLERAVATGRLDIAGSISLCASAAFLRRNQSRSMDENLAASRKMIGTYQRRKIPLKFAGIMAAFGCNFEMDIPPARTADLVGQILDMVNEAGETIEYITLADTMAWATPVGVQRVVGAVRERYPDVPLALHLHDTRGMGIANAWAGISMGIDRFDATIAGLGGCPFAATQGAAGNVCTEDLAFLSHESGIETGLDLERLIEVAQLAERIVGHPLPGATKQGGSLHRQRLSKP
jgi:hydroxymethylglutaryl-CoA lyase